MSIKTGHSLASDPRQAVLEMHQAIAQPETALVIFFCSSDYDLDVLAAEINTRFAGIPVIGATTAGEIGPAGYRAGSLVGVSFSVASCTPVIGHITGMSSVGDAAVQALGPAAVPWTKTDDGWAYTAVYTCEKDDAY